VRLQVDNLEQGGFAPDQADVNLPGGVFTDLRNFRFRDGAMEKVRGTNAILGSLSATAIWISSITDGINQYWCYGTQQVMYATDGSNHQAISSATFTASVDLGYTGGPFHGFMVMNDGAHYPRSWTPGLANEVEPLANWPADTFCKVIRGFGDFLVALRITQDGVYNPRLLRWSDAAPIGALPGSWDYTDPTNQAGITEIGQTQDELIDCLPLRDVNIVYKQNNTWIMTPVGLPDVFGFRQLFSESGLLTEDCVAALGGYHFAVTDNDVILHDGAQADSLLERTLRKWLFNALDQTYYRRSFVVTDTKEKETWFCFPESGSEFANLALVWSSVNRKPYVRELGTLMSAGATGIVGGAIATWNAETQTWDAGTGVWDEANFSPTARRLILAAAAGKLAYHGNVGETFNGQPMNCYAVRSNLTLSKDLGSVKTVKAIWPVVYGTDGDTFTARVGVSNAPAGAVTWSNTYSFTIGSDYKIDTVGARLAGRFVHLRFGYVGSNAMRLAGFHVDWDPVGRR
jgi:hypothetical protein